MPSFFCLMCCAHCSQSRFFTPYEWDLLIFLFTTSFWNYIRILILEAFHIQIKRLHYGNLVDWICHKLAFMLIHFGHTVFHIMTKKREMTIAQRDAEMACVGSHSSLGIYYFIYYCFVFEPQQLAVAVAK